VAGKKAAHHLFGPSSFFLRITICFFLAFLSQPTHQYIDIFAAAVFGFVQFGFQSSIIQLNQQADPSSARASDVNVSG